MPVGPALGPGRTGFAVRQARRQVEMPKIEYAGHQPISPVTNGTTPIHPSGVAAIPGM